MTLGEAKVMVKALMARGDLEPLMLDFFLAQGRRLIESETNFYWMKASKDFNLTVNQGEYVITASPVSVSDFKDMRYLLWKDPSELRYNALSPNELDILDTNYETTGTGAPEAFNLDNVTIRLFPIDPDQAYNMRLYYWAWTANPTNDTSTDELLTRWPDVLIYASVSRGLMTMTQNVEAAKPWIAMMKESATLLMQYNHARGQALEAFTLTPSDVPTGRVIPTRGVAQPGAIPRWSNY